ncbi:PK beta-barrel-protein domain-containing protein-like protein [Durotheca rogersii]|uniref:PK beta-barrel-protein domain-containing protein-like protein n=1 Tax=Durotheca rogersii TaxID=419775 RepID=UPI00221EC419|nr:PK beta-barrel-protein domain-containing protein-like protein [Durotheca rogersii]KAI5860050.1 PK beta-barrel-protein domain-containing protein-like protein [Durotheca rogersii]
MAPSSHIDLFAPCERDIILEVRSSRMVTMPGLKIESGIDKKPRSGRIPVSFIGLDADEHDLVFHGGRDKAIHGYCCSHYYAWQTEFPEAAARFQRGGFGENFVTEYMNERNICIGDVVSVGSDGVLLQVSLPRQPCFKLNHRFQLKNFAPNTYRASRTGWYYRVLREGTVQAGDEIRLVERRWPKWTIERVQEYLHRNPDDAAANEELAAIADMGDESRKTFEKRVEKLKVRQRRATKGKGEGEDLERWRDFRIVEKKTETPRVASFILEAVSPGVDLPEAGARVGAGEPLLGSYARLRLPNGLVRSYSIISGTCDRFELGVALAEPTRGGSAYLHGEARVGDVLAVGRIASDLQPAGAASSHVFVAGGIGITAFLALLKLYRNVHWDTTLHLAVRSVAEGEVPFRELLEELSRGSGVSGSGDGGNGVKLHLYDGSRGERVDIPRIFAEMPWNAHVYVCGPDHMMAEAMREAKRHGLGPDEVHFEAFSAQTGGDPFEVEVYHSGSKANRSSSGSEKCSSGAESGSEGGAGPVLLKVGADETLLEVLRRRFGEVAAPSSCEAGNCGTCQVTLRQGRVEHRGTALADEEQRGALLSCVSRGVGRITVEI